MPVVPVLQPLMQGPLAPYLSSLCLAQPETRSSVTAADLLKPQTMATLLRRFRPVDWEDCPQAVFSHWSQYYFLRLLPPVLAANLLYRQDLPLMLADLRLVLTGDGVPSAFLLKGDGQQFRDDVCEADRFFALREQHLAPLISAWSEQAGMSERVFWSNARACFDWTLDQLQQTAGCEQVVRPLRSWLQAPSRRPGWHRRTCCLRDRLSGIAVCSDCPKSHEL